MHIHIYTFINIYMYMYIYIYISQNSKSSASQCVYQSCFSLCKKISEEMKGNAKYFPTNEFVTGLLQSVFALIIAYVLKIVHRYPYV